MKEQKGKNIHLDEEGIPDNIIGDEKQRYEESIYKKQMTRSHADMFGGSDQTHSESDLQKMKEQFQREHPEKKELKK